MKRLAKKILGIIADQFVRRTAEIVATETARAMAATVDKITERMAILLRLSRIQDVAEVDPHVVFRGVNDALWGWLNLEGQRIVPEIARLLPALPDTNLQLSTGPDTGDACLRRGFKEYLLFKRLCESHAKSLTDCGAILDFGCGWGRLLRFFMKDVSPKQLWGVDAWAPCIDAAKRTNPWCYFDVVMPTPPTPFAPASFDLVYAYSVFSHLREDVHAEWLSELSRIMKPDGLLIATTFPRDHILAFERLRHSGIPEHDPVLDPYFKIYPTLFQHPEKWLAEYDRGGYCYEDFGRGDGDAVIPKGYVLNHWTKYFAFVDYIDDPRACDQNVIVMKKPRDP
jgi:SAM-dependent methyltransferase